MPEGFRSIKDQSITRTARSFGSSIPMETRSNFGSQKFGTTKIRNNNESTNLHLTLIPFLRGMVKSPLAKARKVFRYRKRAGIRAQSSNSVARLLFSVVRIQAQRPVAPGCFADETIHNLLGKPVLPNRLMILICN